MLHAIPNFDKIPAKWVYAVMIVFTLLTSSVLLLAFKNKLPRDKGREFAVEGALSAGKPKAAGILFIFAFAIASLVFVPITIENIAYVIIVLLAMLSGFLDDKARVPWREYKKGAIDLAIGIVTALTFILYNPDLLSIGIGGFVWQVPKALFAVAGIILVWVSINATNCSDGIDGFSGTLSIIAMVSIGISIFLLQTQTNILMMTAIMCLALLPYLWLNAEPSKLLMGDAGSRAIGLFISIAILKTGNILLMIPFCFVLLFDGMAGIIKVSLIRFLHLNLLKNIRTPLHDHFRKNKGWSNTQTIYRLCIIQVLVSVVTIMFLK